MAGTATGGEGKRGRLSLVQELDVSLGFGTLEGGRALVTCVFGSKRCS